MRQEQRIYNIVIGALFIALSIIFTRLLAIPIGTFRIGLGLVPIHYAAFWLGPIWGFMIAVISDLIGIVLNPSGPPHYGITLTFALRAVIAGLIAMYPSRSLGPVKVVLTVLIDMLVCSLLLMSLWMAQILNTPYWTMFITRVPNALMQGMVLIIVEILLLPVFRMVQKQVPVRFLRRI